jgi:hypothetical protein
MWKHATIEPEYDTTKKKSYGLKSAVAELYPDQAGYEDGVLFDIVNDQLLEYNKKDVEFTYKIAKHWYSKLTHKQQRCLLIEAESLPLIAQANLNGMLVDLDAAKQLEAALDKRAEELLAELTPHGVTEKIIRSPKQLGELIQGLKRQTKQPFMSCLSSIHAQSFSKNTEKPLTIERNSHRRLLRALSITKMGIRILSPFRLAHTAGD